MANSSMSAPSELLTTSTVRVSEVRAECRTTTQVLDAGNNWLQLVFVCRGALLRKLDDDYQLIDAAFATVFKRGDTCALEPFGSHGVDCTVLGFGEVDTVTRFSEKHAHDRRLPVTPSTALALRLLISDAKVDSPLAIEGRANRIARTLVGLTTESKKCPSVSERRAVEDVREIIAENPFRPYSLGDVARQLSMSPFHLAHVFKAVTGSCIGRYQMRLRLNLALDVIARGERNLSAVALDHGFTSHSHFTRLFRREFGSAPSEVRAMFNVMPPFQKNSPRRSSSQDAGR